VLLIIFDLSKWILLSKCICIFEEFGIVNYDSKDAVSVEVRIWLRVIWDVDKLTG
jgi:hypothetical protein